MSALPAGQRSLLEEKVSRGLVYLLHSCRESGALWEVPGLENKFGRMFADGSG